MKNKIHKRNVSTSCFLMYEEEIHTDFLNSSAMDRTDLTICFHFVKSEEDLAY